MPIPLLPPVKQTTRSCHDASLISGYPYRYTKRGIYFHDLDTSTWPHSRLDNTLDHTIYQRAKGGIRSKREIRDKHKQHIDLAINPLVVNFYCDNLVNSDTNNYRFAHLVIHPESMVTGVVDAVQVVTMDQEKRKRKIGVSVYLGSVNK